MRRLPREWWTIYYFFTVKDSIYWSVFMAMALLGFLINPFCFAYHLVMFIFASEVF
jgi:hypothetical protein